MLSKLLRMVGRTPLMAIRRHRKVPQLQVVWARTFRLIPPDQYSTPWPKRLQVMYVLRECWETVPLFVVMVFWFSLMMYYIWWTCKNKVDVVYLRHSGQNISRTMDLRDPTVHKLIIINQKYEPWPEMQDVLDKMKEAEKRLLLEKCDAP